MDHPPLSDPEDEGRKGLTSDLAFLSGGGEMGKRIREFDWSKTSLGPTASWPQSLRSAVSILLPSKAQIILFWGRDFVTLYNDGYRPVFGGKHPRVLGLPGRESWSELWEGSGLRSLLEGVLNTGEAFWASDRLFVVERFEYVEETYFDVSYDPVRDETGKVAGVFCIVSETTGRVVGERRMKTLRELSARTIEEARSVDEACRAAVRILEGNRHDVPFALMYLLDEEGKTALLAGSVGLSDTSPAVPRCIDTTAKDEAGTGWPFAAVLESNRAEVVTDLSRHFGVLPGGVWPESPHTAVILPINAPAQNRLAGLFVIGVSPRRPLDDEYRGFLDLLANQLSTSIANARSYEEERKRAEALAELDRAKTAFFSNVSHELRTPLTLMLGPLEELKAQFGRSTSTLDTSQYQQVDLVHRNGLRLLKLVNTLLDFSRIEAGRVQAVYEETDLAALTADLASVFRSAIEKAGLSLLVECPPLPEPVFVDRGMWEKIVLNLLSNAFKFTFEGEIEVALRPSGTQVELSIRDTGTGIPDDQLDKIFERFHRVAGAHGRTYEGTGIGLSLVQELARLHGGSVSVESDYGKGSTFRVCIPFGKSHLPHHHLDVTRDKTSTAFSALPFVEEAARWLSSEEGSESEALSAELPIGSDTYNSRHSPLTTRSRVLLADDNADMRDYVRRLLVSQGYEVEAVADGQVALDRVRANPPDLLLTDVMMPRLDGVALLKALRADARTRALPIIMLSARAGEEARVEGLDAGADDYLIKPFSARELLARVRSQVEMARLRREHEERVSGILNSLTDGFQTIDDRYRFRYFNAAAHRLFAEQGMNPDDLIGRHIFEDVFPSEREKPWAIELRRTMDERVPTEVETFYAPWQRWLAARSYPAPDGGVSVFFQDVTQRKCAEEALRESEQETKRARDYAEATLRTSPLPLLVLGKDLRVNTANEAFYQTFQVSTAETQGRLVYELGNGQWNIPKLRELLERILPQRKVFKGFEVTHHFESIGRRTMLLNARQMENEPDTPDRIVLVIEDITERKEAEEALRKSRERFEIVSEAAEVGFWFCDLPFDELIWDSRVKEHFWLPPNAPVTIETFYERLHPDDRERTHRAIEDSIENSTRYDIEYRTLSPDGEEKWIRAIGRTFYDENDKPIRFDGVTLDITERKAIQERLRLFTKELEAQVEDRTRDLVQSQHRLRALATELNLAEQRERKRIATELHDHLQQMLVLGKLKLGQGKRLAQPIPACAAIMKDTDEVLSEALQYTRTLVAELSPPVLREHGFAAGLKWLGEYMKKHDVTVTVTVPDKDDLKLPEDQAVLLFQSVRELLINSWKHAGTGQATVTLERHSDCLQVEVSDEGAGFDLAAAAAAAGTPSGGISSKFGLFSIRERMRALGGSFEIESTPGKGTMATLTFPLRSSAECAVLSPELSGSNSALPGRSVPRTQHSELQKNAPIRVLLVDDHIMVRQGLKAVLDAYADVELVGEAGNGEEAVQMVDQLRPAVVVMDINMPKMNGVEATVHIKLRHPETIVIGLSVNVAGENQEAMKSAGAALVLTKEAAVEELYEAIMRHVGCAKELDSHR